MPRLPSDFSALLTPKGRRVLEGRDAPTRGVLKTGRRFIALQGLIAPTWSAALLATLERELAPHLEPMESPIPPEAMFGMTENYSEQLPKTVRSKTLELDARRSKGAQAAEACGLAPLLRSEGFGRFAEAISGRKVRRRWGTQVLAYGPGDYAGPHNDHHPEDAEARDGYTDVHLTFCTAGVARQALVYAPLGHFSEEASVATRGGITAYRLPFWHYTTPLVAKRGAEQTARRWVLLGTFIDA